MDEVLDTGVLYHNKLLVDYLQEKPKLVTFLEKGHTTLKPINFTGDRRILRDILLRYNRFIGAPREVLRNIEKVKERKTFFVVTGQQPGVLTGPLYTIYKSLSTIYYSKKFSNDNIILIPLFWNASEDHDINEVNSITLLTKNKELKTFKVNMKSVEGKSIEHIKLEETNIKWILEEIIKALPTTDFTEYVFKDVMMSELSKSIYWGEFFSRLLTNLLGQWGLIIIEPYAFRPYLKEFFVKLLDNPIYYNRIFLDTTKKLQNLGYSPKLHKKENIVGLFYIDETGKRNKITINNKNEFIFDNGMTLTKEEIKELAYKHPERFSTNAIFRPLAQDKMIPTFIYAGGPSEIGYHIQITKLYPAFGITQPNLLLRMGATIVERHIDKVLQKYSVNILELQEISSLIKRLLKEKHRKKLDPYLKKILATLDSLKKDLGSLSKELETRVEHKKQQIQKILANIEEMYIDYLKRENNLLVSKLRKANENIFPLGKPQERVFNVFQYLNKYSFCFLDCVKQVFEQYKPGSHVVIRCWT